MNLIEERTVALAAILQVSAQVQKLARTGMADEDVVQTALRSILILDAASTEAVFGGLSGVGDGLSRLANGALVSTDGENIEVLRYAMSLLGLQNQLMRDGARFAEFGTEVERLSSVEAVHIHSACSDIYQKFISDLQPQIIVQGEQDFLQQEDIPARVRALLLAGIRAAVLWQQKGGGRFKLVWERTRMRNAASALLNQIRQ